MGVTNGTAAGDPALPGAPPTCEEVDVDAAGPVETRVDRAGCPAGVEEALRRLGIDRLRRVQALAARHGLFQRRSMLVCSPSGSGKTLVGELACLASVLGGHGKAAYLVPLKALATEKYRHFTKAHGPAGIKVRLCIGDHDVTTEELLDADVIVMTYEKMDSLVRASSGSVDGFLGTVVVDEIHVLGEPGRGGRLESLVIRLSAGAPGLQLVGLSATIANPSTFGSWLGRLGYRPVLLRSSARPVPLHHEVVACKDETGFITRVAVETSLAGGQCLVFSRSRRKAEATARALASSFKPVPGDTKEARAKRVGVAFRLKQEAKHSALPGLIVAGVAFHHAGLSAQERETVERAFKDGDVKVICCTTTLGAGINLPARAVVVQDYKQVAPAPRGSRPGPVLVPMPRNAFHQVAGRAGRPGYDDAGTCYVLARSRQECEWIKSHYFHAPAGNGGSAERHDPLLSMIADEDMMLEQLLINVLEQGETTPEDLEAFFKKSYFTHLLPEGAASVDALLRVRAVAAADFGVLPGAVPGASVRVSEATPGRVVGTVLTMSTGGGEAKRHDCQLSSAGGMSCSCGGGGRAADGPPGTPCSHVCLLLGAVLSASPGLATALDAMVATAVREGCHVDYLVEHGLVEPTPAGTYSCTAFGRLVAKLYVRPATAVLLRDAIVDRATSKRGPGMAFPAWLFQAIKRARAKEGRPVHDSLLVAAWLWISEEPMEGVLQPGRATRAPPPLLLHDWDRPVYPGDLASFVQDARRWSWVVGRLAGHLGAGPVERAAAVMAARLEHGVKEELAGLAGALPSVGRVRGRLLFNAGYDTVVKVRAASAPKLHGDTRIPLATCVQISKEALRRCGVPGETIEREGDGDGG